MHLHITRQQTEPEIRLHRNPFYFQYTTFFLPLVFSPFYSLLFHANRNICILFYVYVLFLQLPLGKQDHEIHCRFQCFSAPPELSTITTTTTIFIQFSFAHIRHHNQNAVNVHVYCILQYVCFFPVLLHFVCKLVLRASTKKVRANFLTSSKYIIANIFFFWFGR